MLPDKLATTKYHHSTESERSSRVGAAGPVSLSVSHTNTLEVPNHTNTIAFTE